MSQPAEFPAMPAPGTVVVAGEELTVSYATSPQLATDRPLTLLAAWDQWFDARLRGETREGTYLYTDAGKAARFAKDSDTTQATRKLVEDLLGDRDILTITAAEWASFNDAVRRIPANHGKSPKDRDLSYAAIIAKADGKERRQLDEAQARIATGQMSDDEAAELLRGAMVPRIAPRTFQRHQKYLAAPLDHAVAEGRLPFNPFKPFVLGEKAITELRRGLPETARKLWHDELPRLLATTAWTADDTAITDPIYWVPLIARLSGMRSEEILQLKPENIRSRDGLDYFEIERGTGQSVKSANGKRLVPIHSQLIELGFLELVAHQRKLGKRRIFDTIPRARTKKNTHTEIMNGRFEYYRKCHGIYERRLDLHGLRTTFNSDLVTLAVPDTARRYLMGHKNPDVGIVNYLPEGFPLTTLKFYIEQQQIDLSPVRRRFRGDTASGPRLAVVGGQRLVG